MRGITEQDTISHQYEKDGFKPWVRQEDEILFNTYSNKMAEL
jgi:hypothetical protein